VGTREGGSRILLQCVHYAPERGVINPLCDTEYRNTENGYGLKGGTHVVSTGVGNDVIDLGSGDHFIDAGEGNNSINTGLVSGQTGTVSIVTGGGDDFIGSAATNLALRMQREVTWRSGDGWKGIYLGHGLHDIEVGDNTHASAASVIHLGNGDARVVTGGGLRNVTAWAGDHTQWRSSWR